MSTRSTSYQARDPSGKSAATYSETGRETASSGVELPLATVARLRRIAAAIAVGGFRKGLEKAPAYPWQDHTTRATSIRSTAMQLEVVRTKGLAGQTHMHVWRALIERVARSKQVFRCTVRRRLDDCSPGARRGKYFVVQFSRKRASWPRPSCRVPHSYSACCRRLGTTMTTAAVEIGAPHVTMGAVDSQLGRQLPLAQLVDIVVSAGAEPAGGRTSLLAHIRNLSCCRISSTSTRTVHVGDLGTIDWQRTLRDWFSHPFAGTISIGYGAARRGPHPVIVTVGGAAGRARSWRE